ncbi:hypothetical protein EDD16DRAFT_1609975 [Pisolithus croceorrhizus]|nr:hypothetical protein EDD16DRAFT_1609975 [Pisolithus croceorrhizus]
MNDFLIDLLSGCNPQPHVCILSSILASTTYQKDSQLVPLITHASKPFLMSPLSTSLQSPMMYIVEHGIGSILVFEYMYFLLQVNPDEKNVEKHFKIAVKEYQTSGVQAKVIALIAVAFQEHGENVEVLCPILVNIAKENQMSKKLLGQDGIALV